MSDCPNCGYRLSFKGTVGGDASVVCIKCGYSTPAPKLPGDLKYLTLEAARNLEAGPETDALIASICGKTGGKIFGTFSPEKDLKFGFPVSDSGLLAMRTWSPSTDANAAIEAAEAVGCNWAAQATCRCESVNKFAMHFLWGQDGNDSLSLAPTFPLALCRAIAVRYVLERDRGGSP